MAPLCWADCGPVEVGRVRKPGRNQGRLYSRCPQCGAFCWLCVWLSVLLIGFSTLRLRVIGQKVGAVPWYRRILGLGAKGAAERPARTVGANPVAWREATARGKTGVASPAVVVGLLARPIVCIAEQKRDMAAAALAYQSQ